MIKKLRLFPCMFILFSVSALADEDMRVLLKALQDEVNALKEQVGHSNARISELEKELHQYRAAASQLPVQQADQVSKISNVKSPDGLLASSADVQKNPKSAVTVGDIKGTYKIPGTDTSIGLGGYVKMDILFNSVSAGRDRYGDQLLIFSQIPVGETAVRTPDILFHAKETRLWFKSFTPK